MSWAAHNPEAFDQVCIDGVTSRILREIKSEGFEGADEDTVRMVVETLATTACGATSQNVWTQLISWAHKDVADSEADYFARQVND